MTKKNEPSVWDIKGVEDSVGAVPGAWDIHDIRQAGCPPRAERSESLPAMRLPGATAPAPPTPIDAGTDPRRNRTAGAALEKVDDLSLGIWRRECAGMFVGVDGRIETSGSAVGHRRRIWPGGIRGMFRKCLRILAILIPDATVSGNPV